MILRLFHSFEPKKYGSQHNTVRGALVLRVTWPCCLHFWTPRCVPGSYALGNLTYSSQGPACLL